MAEPFAGGDADLVSGLSSTAFDNDIAEDDEDAADEQQAEFEQPFDISEAIAHVDAEIAAVSDIRAYRKTLGPRPAGLQFEKEYWARELYIDYLERLKSMLLGRADDMEDARQRRREQYGPEPTV